MKLSSDTHSAQYKQEIKPDMIKNKKKTMSNAGKRLREKGFLPNGDSKQAAGGELQ